MNFFKKYGLAVSLFFLPTFSWAQSVATFSVTDDAGVRSSNPNKNVGGLDRIAVRNTGTVLTNSYLKFNVAGITGSVLSATVRLQVVNASDDGGSIFSVNNNWNEGTLTWSNAPPITGPPLSSAGAISNGQIVALDVTATILGNGIVSFALQNNSADQGVYSSKEGTFAPDLVIQFNQPPVADAGPDQIVVDADNNGTEDVTLDGSGSSDVDGTIVSYSWIDAGTQIATGVNPLVTLTVGIHTIDLTVTDDLGATATDQVVITVNPGGANQPPVANAGPDQTVADVDNNGTENVTLDGSGSSDQDGTIVSYSWSEAGTQIATGVNPLVTLAVGVHPIDLTVTDDLGATATDQVIITVNANQVPTANAGPDQTVTDVDNNGSENITLDGSLSSDPDGMIVSYVWSEVGTQIATGVNPLVTLAVGTHTVDLTVTDDGGATATDQVVVTVNAGGGIIVFPVTDDAAVRSSNPDANAGGANRIRVRNTGTVLINSYVKFNVSGLPGSVASAIVRLQSLSTSADGGSIFSVGNNWNETTLTWNNAPPITGPPLSSAGAITSGQIVELDVTDAVTGNGDFSFALQNTSSQKAEYSSKEGGTAPELLITFIQGSQPPVANAGPDQTVADTDNNGVENVTLDGSGSFDPDGTIVSYVWNEAGSQIATGVNPVVTLAAGVHTIDLTVTDDSGDSDTDQVVIKVNQAPIANAGPDQTVTDVDNNGGEDVMLDGTGSTDSDGTIVSYTWVGINSGSVIGTGANPTVTLVVGTHSVELTVVDDDGATAVDTVVIKVNQPPIAHAGPDQTVADADNNGDENVTLDGSASVDNDGTIVSYVWSENGNTIATGTTAVVTLNVGIHTIDLAVTDDIGAVTMDQVIITVNANVPPVANAGPDQTVTDADNNGSENITLDGSGSSDTDGTIVSYSWSEAGSPIAAGVNPTVLLALGTHTIDLTVIDNGGMSTTDQVMVIVNQPPVANAGPDQTVADADNNGSEIVTLDGSGSSDVDGTIVSYSWSEAGAQIATGVNPLVTFAIGPHLIDLTVTDDRGGTATDQVVINITSGAPNQPPLANAGPDQTVTDTDNTGAENVTLDGSGSFDTDGTIVSYVWGEAGNQMTTGVTPTVALAVGSHTIDLVVTDNLGATDSDTVVVTIVPVYTLTMAVSPASSGTTNPPDGTTTTHVENTVVTITATANPGFAFVNWTGATGIADPNSPSTTVTMDGDKTVTANFIPTFTLTMAVSPAGAGTTIPAAGTTTTYSQNDVASISATAGPGFMFVNWTGASNIADPTNPNTTVTMDGNKTITANFAIGVNLTMAVFPPGAGTTTPADGTITGYPANTVVPISATANQGFVFGYWTGIPAVDADQQNGNVTMDVDKTVTANFLELPPAAGETTASSLGLSGALAAYGPLNFFGFPSYYTDTNGITLLHGVNVNDPLTPENLALNDPTLLPNPNAPLDISTANFFEESFYNSVSAIMPTSAGTAILVYAGGEGVFFTPDLSVQDGFQTVFNRIRIRIDLPPVPAGQTRTYVVTHPYGVNTFQVTQGGPNAINFTVDSATQIGFSSALDGTFVPVDPFLVWTDGAPAGYIGDPNFDHTVTGSPTNTNFFRIDGPDISGPGANFIQTSLFSVSGKLLGTANIGGSPPPNQPPVAFAGLDQSVIDANDNGSESVTLDGSPSFDTDGTIAGYIWSEGSSQIATGANPTVILTVGVHTIVLTVTDDDNATGTDTVIITVNTSNLPPIANAGPDQTVTDTDNNGSEAVTLDGSSSSDPDGTIVSYAWSEAGTQIATGVNPTVTLAVGTHTIDLTVTDDGGKTGTDQVVVTVIQGNTFILSMAVSPSGGGTTSPPAGSSTTFPENTVVNISATASPSFSFVNWTGSVADPNDPNTTVTMDSDKTVTANFIATYSLTMAVFPAGGGTTTPAIGSVTTYPAGTLVNLSAVASPGFVFGYWKGIPAVVMATNNTTVTMDSNITVTGNFLELPPAAGETTASDLGLSGSLAAYGPLNIFGYPTYYTDTNGLSLLHGINVSDPLTPENLALTDPALLPDPNAPLDISSGNFFDESFYFSGSALMPTSTGNALLVYAGGEGVFFSPDMSPVEGFQTVFNRLRIRIDLPPVPAGQTRTYVVTHPYGVETFQVTQGGPNAINHTIDSATQVGFESPLDGTFVSVDPFLVWTNNDAPPGYVGDPNIDHTVTGSPFNTNFFRVSGPDIGGTGINLIETDLFSISGKILGTAPPVAAPGDGDDDDDDDDSSRDRSHRSQTTDAGIADNDSQLSSQSHTLPSQYALQQNYPNPFNPSTRIVYELPEETNVRLEILTVLGQKIRTLFEGHQEAGTHGLTWQALDDNGRRVESGIYVIRMTTNRFVSTRKMVLIK